MVFYKCIYYLAPYTTLWVFLYTVVITMVQVNITLAMFNLLPVPPLDGSRIFNMLLPPKFYFSIMRYERYILVALFALLWLGALDVPLGYLYSGALRALDWATAFLDLILA